MTFAEQLAAALADRDLQKSEYDAAEAKYQALLTQSVSNGVDVSQFQGDVDWPTVAGAPTGFTFVRSADGDVNDTRYTAARVTAIRAAGIPFAPYQFARVASATNGQRDGKTEAAMAYYFARRQGWGKTGDLPLVYDFENDSWKDQSAAKSAAHCVQAVATPRALIGRPCIFYTNPSTMAFIGPALDADGRAELARCPLWISHWGVTSPTVPAPWADWTFWQYSSTGTVPGMTGAVDLDRFSGSKTDLDALKLP